MSRGALPSGWKDCIVLRCTVCQRKSRGTWEHQAVRCGLPPNWRSRPPATCFIRCNVCSTKFAGEPTLHFVDIDPAGWVR